MSDETDRPEVWISVLGYEGRYEVSNHGRVRRADGDLLRPSQTNGYLHLSLCKDGTTKTHRLHILVLSSFCGPKPFDGAHAAHNDGISTNCRLSNLRWTTPIENQADVDRHGRRCRGESVFGAILTEGSIKQIRERCVRGERNRSIAEDYGVSISTIHLIRHNRIWKHV